jgi:hypothetical protein
MTQSLRAFGRERAHASPMPEAAPVNAATLPWLAALQAWHRRRRNRLSAADAPPARTGSKP